MKFILTLITILFISFSGKTQITKGNWLVGGSVNFSSINDKFTLSSIPGESNYTNLLLSIRLGYFLRNKFAIGLLPSYSWNKSADVSGNTGSSNVKRLEIGPFVRYYFLKEDKPFNIIAEAIYQYGIINQSKLKGNNNIFSFNAGPVLYFNSSVGLEFLIGYYMRNEKIPPALISKQNSFQVGVGFQIHLEK